MKKSLLPAVIVLFLLFTSTLQAEVIHVPGDYLMIQYAVDAASNGDTILVADGTWEKTDIENKALTIRSDNGPGACTVSTPSKTDSGFHISSSASVTVEGFTITGDGVGIYIDSPATALIDNCVITWNWEGGIVSMYGDTTIRNCEISTNVNRIVGGGGIHAWGDFTVENCFFYSNATWYIPSEDYWGGQGGAIWCTFSSPTITNCTFIDNMATTAGGAIASSEDHAAAARPAAGRRGSPVITVENCILWGGNAGTGNEVYMSWGASLDISYSTVESGQTSISGPFAWGDGMIDDDPLFVTGSLGDHFLSQTAAGQAVDSPCVDTGNPATPLRGGTTRTDLVPDSGVVDMGWHYEQPSGPAGPFLAAGPGAAESNPPLVRIFPPEQGAAHVAEFAAYGADSFGVNVTTGDINGDGRDSIITGAGPGAVYGPHIRGFTSAGSAIAEINFLAYGTNKYGVNVVCGDITGNGRDEIITGAGPGAVFGPHVRAFTNTGTAMEPMPGVNYFAYGTPKWGVNVAAGDIDGDGFDEIVTGAGPGSVYGPHVRGWNVDDGTATAIPGVSYMAYGTNKMGVRVSCGDVDGDGIDEIVTGPGPSMVFGAHVACWNYDGVTVAGIPGINFFAWQPGESLYGVTVSAAADFNGDGRSEIVTGQGPDSSAGTEVRVFSYDLVQTTLLFDIDTFGDSGLTHGVNAAGGSY